MNFSALTLNLHKGFSPLRRKFILPQLREALRKDRADIVFLQEIIGENCRHQKKYKEWPESNQLEYLADQVWSDYAYAQNSVYSAGHHGNAILSHFPIKKYFHKSISAHSLEQRGLLHAVIQISEETDLHVICIHFGLFENWRKKQVKLLTEHIEGEIKKDSPLIIAGDFNDWRSTSHQEILSNNNLNEAHLDNSGSLAKTFPARIPIFKLDRIYYRSLKVHSSAIGKSPEWRKLSDHMPLKAEFSLHK